MTDGKSIVIFLSSGLSCTCIVVSIILIVSVPSPAAGIIQLPRDSTSETKRRTKKANKQETLTHQSMLTALARGAERRTNPDSILARILVSPLGVSFRPGPCIVLALPRCSCPVCQVFAVVSVSCLVSLEIVVELVGFV